MKLARTKARKTAENASMGFNLVVKLRDINPLDPNTTNA